MPEDMVLSLNGLSNGVLRMEVREQTAAFLPPYVLELGTTPGNSVRVYGTRDQLADLLTEALEWLLEQDTGDDSAAPTVTAPAGPARSRNAGEGESDAPAP